MKDEGKCRKEREKAHVRKVAEDYFILFSFYSKLTFFFPSRFSPAFCIQFCRFHHRRSDFSKGIARRSVCVFEGGRRKLLKIQKDDKKVEAAFVGQ